MNKNNIWLMNPAIFWLILLCTFSAACLEKWSSDTVFSLGKRYYFDKISVFIPIEDGWKISSYNTKEKELMVLQFAEGDRQTARITISTLANDDTKDSVMSVSNAFESILGLPDSAIELKDEPYGTMATWEGKTLQDGIIKAYQYCGTDEELLRQQKAREIAGLVTTLVFTNLVMIPMGRMVLTTPDAIKASMPAPIRKCRYFISYLKALDIPEGVILNVLLTTSAVDTRYSHFMRFIISSIVFNNKPVMKEKQYTKYVNTCSAVMLKNGTYGQGSIDSINSANVYFRKHDSKTTVRLPKKTINWYSTGRDTTYLNQ